MTPAGVYTLLFSAPGEPVTVVFTSKKEYQSLLRSLHRHHANLVSIGGTELSIVSNFSTAGSKGTFTLAQKRGQNNYKIEIENEQEVKDEKVRGPVEADSQQGNSEHNLPDAGDFFHISSDLQRKISTPEGAEANGLAGLWKNRDFENSVG